MYVVIAGCSASASIIARELSANNFDVVIIDRNKEAFKKLSLDFSGKTVVGNVLEQEVLTEAGIDNADIFLALTDDDNVNVVSSQIVKKTFNVPKIVVVLNHHQKSKLCQGEGINIVFKSNILADFIKKICL